MGKFADQLFDDLMREHGPTLAAIRVPAARKPHLATRPALLTAGAGGLAAAAAVGTLVAGGTPAYAVTGHLDGTVTLAVYQKSGIAGVNAKLHQIGDGRVVVVPAEPGCPGISSLPIPEGARGHVSHQGGVAAQGGKVTTHGGQGVKDGGKVTEKDGKPPVLAPAPGKEPVSVVKAKDGSVVVSALSVPPGDTLVLAFATTANGMSEGAARLTTGPVPSCVSLPAPPAEGGHGSVARTGGSAGVPGVPGVASSDGNSGSSRG